MIGDGMTDFNDQSLFLLGANLPHYVETRRNMYSKKN